MSVTALTMIRRAMRIMTVLGTDAQPTAQEATDGLYALNSMLEAWGIERLMVYQVQQNSYSWTVNQASQTIGPSGTFNTTRPTKVAEEGNFFRDGSTSIDYPLMWLGDRDSYDRILLKTTTSSYPQWLFVDTGFPLMTLYVWPVPTQSLTLHLNTWKPLQSFTSLTTDIALPPGYQAAIEFNLALWYAPEFGTAAKIPPWVEKQAPILKANIKAINRPDLVARLDNALLGQGTPYNIYTDGPAVAN